MSVSKIGHDQWYSSLTNNVYTSETAAKKYENEERIRSTPESGESKFMASLSQEQLKYYIQNQNARVERILAKIDWKHATQNFVNANPDYLPNEANGSALAATLVALGKYDPVADVFLGTMADMQEAYIDLAEKGMLKLRAGARLPQRADEAEAYTLPLDELRRRSLASE